MSERIFKYSEEEFPPMSMEEWLHFSEVLKENWDLYLDQPYLRWYWGYEHLRLCTDMHPSELDKPTKY